MEKKDIIFALKLFIAGVLLGIFAGFLGVNPLGISQAQVIIALKSLFLGLGMITARYQSSSSNHCLKITLSWSRDDYSNSNLLFY